MVQINISSYRKATSSNLKPFYICIMDLLKFKEIHFTRLLSIKSENLVRPPFRREFMSVFIIATVKDAPLRNLARPRRGSNKIPGLCDHFLKAAAYTDFKEPIALNPNRKEFEIYKKSRKIYRIFTHKISILHLTL